MFSGRLIGSRILRDCRQADNANKKHEKSHETWRCFRPSTSPGLNRAAYKSCMASTELLHAPSAAFETSQIQTSGESAGFELSG